MRQLASLAAAFAVLAVGACSSTFGGGSSPPPPKVVVVPQGQATVCPNGNPPPCQ